MFLRLLDRLVQVAGHLRDVTEQIGDFLEAQFASFGLLGHHMDFLVGEFWLLVTDECGAFEFIACFIDGLSLIEI